MTILVTGGTGLVGSHVVESLISEGHDPSDIRALVRAGSDAAFLKEMGVKLYVGDLLEAGSLKAATRNVQVIFHCAAALEEKRTGAFWETNCQGTGHLLEAARCAQVEKFIHVSTIGIYGLLTKVPAAEDHPQEPLRPYAMSKLGAEKKVWEYHRTYGMNAVVLRPTAIVGERDRHITGRIMDLTRKTIIPLVNAGKALMSFVHAGDVASALILASKSEQAVGRAYNVQGFSAPLRHVLEFFIEAVRGKAKMVPIPYSMAYVGALLIDIFYATAWSSRPPIRARRGLQALTRDLIFDTTRIKKELAFESRYGMEESFLQAIQWRLDRGA